MVDGVKALGGIGMIGGRGDAPFNPTTRDGGIVHGYRSSSSPSSASTSASVGRCSRACASWSARPEKLSCALPRSRPCVEGLDGLGGPCTVAFRLGGSAIASPLVVTGEPDTRTDTP